MCSQKNNCTFVQFLFILINLAGLVKMLAKMNDAFNYLDKIQPNIHLDNLSGYIYRDKSLGLVISYVTTHEFRSVQRDGAARGGGKEAAKRDRNEYGRRGVPPMCHTTRKAFCQMLIKDIIIIIVFTYYCARRVCALCTHAARTGASDPMTDRNYFGTPRYVQCVCGGRFLAAAANQRLYK